VPSGMLRQFEEYSASHKLGPAAYVCFPHIADIQRPGCISADGQRPDASLQESTCGRMNSATWPTAHSFSHSEALNAAFLRVAFPVLDHRVLRQPGQ
jgi:hypothetical protein